jgi:8-oxo-dGTP diphosphatase
MRHRFNKTFNEPSGDGWHLTTNEMLQLNKRPCAEDKLLGVSTHNLTEALKAQSIVPIYAKVSLYIDPDF